MRGGNWYNGDVINGVNDGHSRVSNRNPSYYRGPQDPNHPWYHVGFRVARKYSLMLGLNDNGNVSKGSVQLLQNYPNPFSGSTTIKFYLPQSSHVSLIIRNILGQEVATLTDRDYSAGWQSITWDRTTSYSNICFATLSAGSYQKTIKMIIIK